MAVCPRHGARIEICTGKPLSLPAVLPVETFPVTVEDGVVKVDITLMLDDQVRAVLARLEAEDAKEREEGVAREQRARQVARSTGQFLFALVAPQVDCEVLEIGGSRGYSSIWLGAGVRHFGGRVLSLEADPAKCRGLAAQRRRGGARGVGRARRGRRVRDAARDQRRVRHRLHRRREGRLRAPLRARAGQGRARRALRRRQRPLARRRRSARTRQARQADPTLESVTVPLDRGLELSVVLTDLT